MVKVAPRLVLPKHIAAHPHALRHLGIGNARAVGAQPVGPERVDRQVVQGHGRIDVLNLPTGSAQAGAQLRLFARFQCGIKAIHLLQCGTTHQHVATKVQGATRGVDPVQIEQLGIERLLRPGLAPMPPGGAQLGLGQCGQCTLHKVGVQFGVAVQKQHILTACCFPTQVTRLGGTRTGVIQYQHARPQRLSPGDAGVG